MNYMVEIPLPISHKKIGIFRNSYLGTICGKKFQEVTRAIRNTITFYHGNIK